MPKQTLAKLIGERLRILRKQSGLSQEELAHLSDLHPTYIGQLERGEKNATLNTIEKVATALGVSLEELFQFSSIKNDPRNTHLKLNQFMQQMNDEDREIVLKVIDILLEWKRNSTKVDSL